MLDLPCPEKGGFWHGIRQCTLHLKISLKCIAGLSLDCFEIQVNKKTVCCWLFVFGLHNLTQCSEAGMLQQWHLWLSLGGEELAPARGWGGTGEGMVQRCYSSGLCEGLEKRKLCNQPTRCEVGAGVFPRQSF